MNVPPLQRGDIPTQKIFELNRVRKEEKKGEYSIQPLANPQIREGCLKGDIPGITHKVFNPGVPGFLKKFTYVIQYCVKTLIYHDP